MRLGAWEIILIIVLVLIVFGGSNWLVSVSL